MIMGISTGNPEIDLITAKLILAVVVAVFLIMTVVSIGSDKFSTKK